MNAMILSPAGGAVRRSYAAKYDVAYFERKRIPSYALWAVAIKDPTTGHYAKIPAGFGQTATLEEAHLDLTAWCEAKNLPYQGVPVGTIKRHATGKGNSNKEAMIAAVRGKGFAPADDNDADALALLMCVMDEKRAA